MESDSADRTASPTLASGTSETTASGAARADGSRSSREETTQRILDAAEDLYSRHDPSRVTVREIAEAAGVTHPLVHQYVGSKSDILDAVIARGAPQRHRIMQEHPDLRDAVPLLVSDILTRRVHTRSLVRAAMDGIEYSPPEDRVRSGRMLTALARESVALGHTQLPGPESMDPRVVMAATTALSYGWVATQDWLVQLFELQDVDPAVLQRQLAEIVLHVAELIHPAAAGPDRET